MSQASMHPLEVVLRLIAAAAPQPWYPRLHAEKVGFRLDRLHYFVELLWLDGLLRKGGGTSETGGGVLLSPAGEEVLRDPEALQRLRAGEPLRSNDRGQVVRSFLNGQQRPVVTRLLLWINILWFAYGLYLAHSRHNAARDFLSTFGNGAGNPAVNLVRHQTGDVSPDDLIRGDWWRLVSCCFVHIGFMHLGFNMYGVYAIGRGAEQMWGRWRYLLIYLLSGLGGSCLAQAYRPTILAGASGALCGILGAEFVWLLLNGRYLPRRVVRRWWWGMGLNLILLGGFSAMANVSALGHGGGLAVGAAAALLLNVQRFGPAGWRWLTLLPVAALPWLGIELIQRQRVVNSEWANAEKRVASQDYDSRLDEASRAFRSVSNANPRLSADKRLAAVLRAKDLLTALDADLGRKGRFRSPEVVAALAKIRADVEERLEQLKEQEAALRIEAEKEEKREAEDTREEEAFTKEFWKRVERTTSAAEKLLAERMGPLFKIEAEKRDAAAMEAARKTLSDQRPELVRLAADLKAAGPYRSETASDAHAVSQDYVVALDRLLSLCEKRLRAGAAWTADDAAELKRQSDTVEVRRNKWQELVEKK